MGWETKTTPFTNEVLSRHVWCFLLSLPINHNSSNLGDRGSFTACVGTQPSQHLVFFSWDSMHSLVETNAPHPNRTNECFRVAKDCKLESIEQQGCKPEFETFFLLHGWCGSHSLRSRSRTPGPWEPFSPHPTKKFHLPDLTIGCTAEFETFFSRFGAHFQKQTQDTHALGPPPPPHTHTLKRCTSPIGLNGPDTPRQKARLLDAHGQVWRPAFQDLLSLDRLLDPPLNTFPVT